MILPERRNIVKYALGFVLGAIVGAAAGLLYAPSSGADLRSEIKTQADTQYAKLQDEWQKGMQEVQNRLDKVNSQVQAVADQSATTDIPA